MKKSRCYFVLLTDKQAEILKILFDTKTLTGYGFVDFTSANTKVIVGDYEKVYNLLNKYDSNIRHISNAYEYTISDYVATVSENKSYINGDPVLLPYFFTEDELPLNSKPMKELGVKTEEERKRKVAERAVDNGGLYKRLKLRLMDDYTVVIEGTTETREHNLSLTIPEYIDKYKVVKIENGAFKDCKLLTEIWFSTPAIIIEDNAFNNCSNLEEIFAVRVVSIKINGSNTFKGCTSLDKKTKKMLQKCGYKGEF